MNDRSYNNPAKLSCPMINGSFRRYRLKNLSTSETHPACTAFSSKSRIHSRKFAPKAITAAVTGVPAQREVFYAKTFPSHDTAAAAHARSRADDHQMGADDSERVWRKVAYVTMPDGSITRTVINVRTPLQASKAYIIYGIMAPDGSIHSYNVEVGTSVTLNWKEGLIF